MVKVRGYRIELGDVEAALAQHPAIQEAVVMASGSGPEARLVAYVLAAGAPPSILDVKRHCAERLPRYMIVDRLQVVTQLPRTQNGKIDRVLLAQREQDSVQHDG
jgi:acyl-coenzyme A synthetase/AMP-(fatty) acid ligase